MSNSKESTVKIDSNLLVQVEQFISNSENKIRYSTKKQFIDIAVLELLNKQRNINSKTLNNLSLKKRER